MTILTRSFSWGDFNVMTVGRDGYWRERHGVVLAASTSTRTSTLFEVQWYECTGHIKYGLFGNTASRLSRRTWLLNHRIKQGAA